MKWKFWKTETRDDYLPLKTDHEQIAGDICVQLGHLSENAIAEILKIVVKRMLPKWCMGRRPYQVNPKQYLEMNPRKAEA